MQRKINFEVIKIKKKMEPMQLLVIAIKCHRLGKRRQSDRNSSKHENSYSKLGGPVFTPKFSKFTPERKELADNVKKKKISDNNRDLKADRIYTVELLILVRSKRTDSWRHMCLSEF